MSKRAAVALAIVVGLIAISFPIAVSIYWAWKQSFDEQIGQVALIAKDVLRRSDESTDQTFLIFSKLEAAHAADPCSDGNIRLMGKLDLGSEQVQAVGYIKDDTLLCVRPSPHAGWPTDIRDRLRYPDPRQRGVPCAAREEIPSIYPQDQRLHSRDTPEDSARCVRKRT